MPPLVLNCIKLASHVQTGAHKRLYAGAGDEFYQYRAYEAGESVARIDWRASAKQNKPLVRQWRQLQTQKVYVWLQQSKLLDVISAKAICSKKEYAEQVFYSLCALLLEGQEEVTLLESGQLFKQQLAPLYQAQQVLPAQNLPALRLVKQGSHCLLFGDFLSLGEEGLTSIQTSFFDTQLFLVQISDPEEVSFPFKGAVEFKGLLEASQQEALRAEELKHQYMQKRAQLKNAYQGLCQKKSGAFIELSTSKALEESVLSLYKVLSY